MNVGDYIRTKDGIIGKIESKNLTGYNDWIIDTLYYNDDEIIDNWTCGIKEYNIIKSSPQIIDLIEKNDYVNGNLVSFVGTDSIEVFWYKDEKQWLDKEDIKTIVTHEQFEAMEYKVGD